MAYRRFTYADWKVRWSALGALAAVGMGVAGYGALGLADPDGQLNAVAVFDTTTTSTHFAPLEQGEHFLVWLTTLPRTEGSHAWDVLVEVRDASGAPVYSASRAWVASRSCTTDEGGGESCSGPARVSFGSFRSAGGTHRIDVTVSSPPEGGRGFSGSLMLTNPALRAGEFSAYLVAGVALAAGWVLPWHVIRKREWERSEMERRARKMARIVDGDGGASGADPRSEDDGPPP